MQSDKKVNFDQILKSQVVRPIVEFWSVDSQYNVGEMCNFA